MAAMEVILKEMERIFREEAGNLRGVLQESKEETQSQHSSDISYRIRTEGESPLN
jgi:predicted NUDIX family phosphoesterase